MEQPEVNEVLTSASASDSDAQPPVSVAARLAANTVAPQACPTCGTAPAASAGAAAPPSWIYAIGRIEPRFPDFRGKGVRASSGAGQDPGPY